MADPKTLKALAAAAAAKLEIEGKADYKITGDIRTLIDEAKRVAAKKALKEKDVIKCVKNSESAEKVLLKQTESWKKRLTEIKKLSPVVDMNTQSESRAQWLK